MDTSKDYYAVLGVLPSIDPDALKAVYRALMKKFHPDVYSGSKSEAEKLSVEINEAYSVLSDPIQRSRYDSERGEADSQAKGQYDAQQDTPGSGAVLTEAQKEIWDYIGVFQPSTLQKYRHLEKFSGHVPGRGVATAC
jgi:curved DNA-binding protein CbpA